MLADYLQRNYLATYVGQRVQLILNAAVATLRACEMFFRMNTQRLGKIMETSRVKCIFAIFPLELVDCLRLYLD